MTNYSVLNRVIIPLRIGHGSSRCAFINSRTTANVHRLQSLYSCANWACETGLKQSTILNRNFGLESSATMLIDDATLSKLRSFVRYHCKADTLLSSNPLCHLIS